MDTFGSKNTTGFGSRMHDSNNPFACFGLRGMTTYKLYDFEEVEVKAQRIQKMDSLQNAIIYP